MGQSFYIYNSGDLKRKDNTLQFISSGGEKRDIPIERIDDIYVMSEMSFNTTFLSYISQYGIPIHFFNYYNFYTGSFYPKEKLLAGQLLVKQVEHYTDYGKRLTIAKKFIEAAADNIYRNLRYYNGRGKDVSFYMSEIDSLIYSKVLSEVYHTQLNPTISYLHEPGVRRFSLCLDVAEIFKPLIGDRLLFSLLNRNQITEKSFTKELNYLHLNRDASRLIAQELEKKLQQTIMHKDLGRPVTYQYLMRLELYKLIKHLIGEKEYEGFRIWW